MEPEAAVGGIFARGAHGISVQVPFCCRSLGCEELQDRGWATCLMKEISTGRTVKLWV